MKVVSAAIFTFISMNGVAFDVITCGDAFIVGNEAKMALHEKAQKRAQAEIERFMGKKVLKPYVEPFGGVGAPEVMAELIETFWCETENTPLHTAYYRLYSSNKTVFE